MELRRLNDAVLPLSFIVVMITFLAGWIFVEPIGGQGEVNPFSIAAAAFVAGGIFLTFLNVVSGFGLLSGRLLKRTLVRSVPLEIGTLKDIHVHVRGMDAYGIACFENDGVLTMLYADEQTGFEWRHMSGLVVGMVSPGGLAVTEEGQWLHEHNDAWERFLVLPGQVVLLTNAYTPAALIHNAPLRLSFDFGFENQDKAFQWERLIKQSFRMSRA